MDSSPGNYLCLIKNYEQNPVRSFPFSFLIAFLPVLKNTKIIGKFSLNKVESDILVGGVVD
jgi:hypothetical protein